MVLFVPLLILLALIVGVINRDYIEHSFLISDTFQLWMGIGIVGLLVLNFILDSFLKSKRNHQEYLRRNDLDKYK